MPAQIVRSEEQLPPVPGGNVVHLLRADPRQTPPNKPVFISLDGQCQMGYAEAIALADQLAYGLQHVLGLAPGDRVAIVAHNSTTYPVLIHACLVAGVVPVPLGPGLVAEDLAYPFSDAEIKCVFADPEDAIVNKVREALVLARHPRADAPETVWLLSDAPAWVSGSGGEKDTRALLDPGKALPVHPVQAAESTVALIIYSSGTTGRMKGVLLSHRNLSAAVLMTESNAPVEEGETLLCFLPMYHGYALLFFVLRAFRMGLPSVVMRSFDLGQMCQAIQQHKVTYLPVVPPIMVLLAKSPVPDQYDLSSLKYISCGAAPLSGQVAESVIDRLGVRVGQGYAMSETSIALSKTGLSDLEGGSEVVSASCGRIVPGIEVRLVNADGQDVGWTRGKDGATEEGEIWVRGPNIFMGYLNSPEATRESFTDGWFRTGDLGNIKDGLIFLTGRSKDLIKVGGRQVAPAELEALILTFHKVADCAVVPLPVEEEANEYPLAFIVPKPEYKDYSFLALETRMWVDRRVSHYKRLKGGVRIVDQIPKSPSGKILHRVLRDQLKAEKAQARAQAQTRAQDQPQAKL